MAPRSDADPDIAAGAADVLLAELAGALPALPGLRTGVSSAVEGLARVGEARRVLHGQAYGDGPGRAVPARTRPAARAHGHAETGARTG